ncbi:hypothetical protein IHE45_05G068500 [Dioscorea alata]|uniref:Uncharacterized protein n=1 Tax=Dioscorea alata TaxID=55571 RepID=A0ACB7W2C4_DIOAL|nr:hypothetical protein IHE45_05G068500 [Dioscorea alata]
MVCRKYDELDYIKTPVEMYSYLEKFLGETARAVWESYKLNFPQDFARDLKLGDNPYNFVNKIRLLLLEDSPNANNGKQQVEAIRKLEQIPIKNWAIIKPFLLDFMYYSCIAGCFYDKTIDECVSDTESIYSIISYLDPDGTIEENSSDGDNEFVGEMLESNKKYRDLQIKDLDQLDQIEAMLAYLE